MNSPESILECVCDEFAARLRAGENPSIEQYALQHPSLSEEISDALASVEMMEQFSRCESDFREQANLDCATKLPVQKLGEFDIVQEIGRGGMGVVYEAVDRTLQRRVALKVLNDSALTTQQHIDRFRRESRLAAQLHHTNIISVFGIGEEDQKHFYAMQYVEGVSIQEILEGLKRLPESNAQLDLGAWSSVDGLHVAAALRSGEFAEPRSNHDDVKDPLRSSAVGKQGTSAILANPSSAFDQTIDLSDSVSNVADINLPPDRKHARSIGSVVQESGVDLASQHFALPSPGDDAGGFNRNEAARRGSTKAFGLPYWRSVARIGIQVADALHYAHVNGILHRDIKPANLLFDPNGTVWVADFGLAKLTETDDLTKTGDVVGTLKYMAPEQLGGKTDARSDTYALGLTLYELLTLQSVCDGENYRDLFDQKQNAIQRSPRSVIAAIPRDLDTIVQKTLEWEPNKRYSSARELSEDLQRYLDDRPILARRITLREHAWRWCCRNRAIAALGAATAILFVLLPMILGWAYIRESEQQNQTERMLNVVLEGLDGMYGPFLENESNLGSLSGSADGGDTEAIAPAMLSQEAARMLEQALVIYDRLAEENVSSKNVALAIESAKARRRVGDLYQQLGQFKKAIEAYEDAAVSYTALAANDPEKWVEVARVYQAIGSINEQRQRPELVRTQYKRALTLLGRSPANNTVKYELARTHYLLAKRQIFEGRAPLQSNQLGGPRRGGPRRGRPPLGDPPGPAGREPRRAPVGFRSDGRRPPGVRRDRRGPPELIDSQSTTERDAKVTHLETAVALLQELRNQDPNAPAYRFLLALCLRENIENRTAANELLNQLVKQFPAVARYRFELCETYRNFGRHSAEGDSNGRIDDLLRARELAEQLVKDQQASAPYRINLAHIYAFLGIEFEMSGDLRQAEIFTRRSIATHESVVQDFPGLAPLSDRLSTADKMRLGRWLLQLGRHQEVIDLLQPLGDRLFKELSLSGEASQDTEGLASNRGKLYECRDLLLPAYHIVGDDVGYLVASSWLDPADDRPRRGTFPPRVSPNR